MQITFDEDKKIFHLRAGGTSYVMKAAYGELLHLYWGKALSDPDCSYLLRPAMRAFAPDTHPDELGISLDILPLEYPSSGTGDFRQPAFLVETADGARLAELKYSSHRILTGKPALEALPSTYIELLYEADTLIVEMRDDVIGLVVELTYTAFRNYDAIARSARFINKSSDEKITILERHERERRFYGCRIRYAPALGRMGARKACREKTARAWHTVDRKQARRIQPSAEPVHGTYFERMHRVHRRGLRFFSGLFR